MKLDLGRMLHSLKAEGGPEALVQRTLAAHGLAPAVAPLPGTPVQ